MENYFKISVNDGKYWIEFENCQSKFKIVKENITSGENHMRDETALGIRNWDSECINLDTDSDSFQCFGISEKVQWNEVVITTEYIELTKLDHIHNAIDRIKEALSHVEFCAYCPGDI